MTRYLKMRLKVDFEEVDEELKVQFI